MKNSPIKKSLVLSALLFLLITFITGTFEGAHDGLTRLGFPIVFLQDTNGKCFDCDSIKWLKWTYLILDLLFSYLLAILLIKLYQLWLD